MSALVRMVNVLMEIRMKSFNSVFLPIFVVSLASSCTPSKPTRLGQALYIGKDLLTDYRPQPSLVTESHRINRPKFPAIDVHTHFKTSLDPKFLLKKMDELGVKRVVNLSGGWGKKLDTTLKTFHGFDPARFLIFCNVDFSRIDEPDFDSQMAKFLEEAHAKGAAGLKVFKNLGLTVKDISGKTVPVDDERLDPIWQKAGELGMPVLIHVADPVAFFKPIDRVNERWLQLHRHPNWSFYGPQFPEREEILVQRNRVLSRHPNTTFIGAHVGNNAEDLKAAGAVLDKYPNFNVDIAGRVAELGRQPYSARRFFMKYQNRILFGTDRYPGRPDQPRYKIYYRFLETQDEYFDYYKHTFPPTGEWKIYGLHLPDEVLKKVYFQNAERLLGLVGK